MIYVQYYHYSTGYIEGTSPPQFSKNAVKPIPACGSDSVLICDARYNLANQKARAKCHGRLRGYIGFTINKGESFTRSHEITGYIPIYNENKVGK